MTLGKESKVTDNEEPTLISKKKILHPCRCWAKKTTPILKPHTKTVSSNGWSRLICSNCGKVNFTKPLVLIRRRKSKWLRK